MRYSVQEVNAFRDLGLVSLREDRRRPIEPTFQGVRTFLGFQTALNTGFCQILDFQEVGIDTNHRCRWSQEPRG